jgi:hypothetical protein
MRRFMAFVVTVVVTLGTVAGSAGADERLVQSRPTGRPGAVPTVYTARGTHLNLCPGQPYTCYQQFLVMPGMVVRRSPATAGRQTVAVTYRSLKFVNGRFVPWKDTQVAATISRGQASVQVPRLQQQLRTVTASGVGTYQLVAAIGWYGANGAVLGTRGYAWNLPADYQCASPAFYCSVRRNGSIYLGTYLGN